MISSILLSLALPTVDAEAAPPSVVRDWTIALNFLQECPTTWNDLIAVSPWRRELSGAAGVPGTSPYAIGWSWDAGQPPVQVYLYDSGDNFVGDADVDASGNVTVWGDVASITPRVLADNCNNPRYKRWFVRVDTVHGDSFLTYVY